MQERTMPFPERVWADAVRQARTKVWQGCFFCAKEVAEEPVDAIARYTSRDISGLLPDTCSAGQDGLDGPLKQCLGCLS